MIWPFPKDVDRALCGGSHMFSTIEVEEREAEIQLYDLFIGLPSGVCTKVLEDIVLVC